MATNDTIIRAPVDTAGQSATFMVKDYPVRVSLYPVADLTASEYADLQQEDPAGTFGDVYERITDGSGAQVRMSSVVTDIMVIASGTYRLDFDNPTSAVGAYIREVRSTKS